MPRILIAEDEERIADFLAKGMRAEGWVTVSVHDGISAASLARDDAFDLLVLDLGLPGLDGQAVLAEIRRRGERRPVVVLTARDGVSDTVMALDGGADDYVTKPFRLEELLARVRARLRAEPTSEPTELAVGRVRLDLRTRRASGSDGEVELTTREFVLLELLMRHPDQVLTRQQLLDHVWGYDFDPGSNVVDVFVGYLRKKLGKSTIDTVRGAGYRFTG